MIFTTFRERRVAQMENEFARVSVTVEGGHVAEIREKATGVNPLWTPPWPSIEISRYSPEEFPEYGNDAESRLLAGIMGHNLCLDLFGPPSDAEAAAGICVHGEAGVVAWDFESAGDGMIARCRLPAAQLAFERRIRLVENRVSFSERVENLSALDRPIAWTQHVTLGPPFLERGKTEFRMSVAGKTEVPETFTAEDVSAGYWANLLDPEQDQAWFAARSPGNGVTFGYVWDRADFPWLGIWEENRSRTQPPWNGVTLTRGMEFGVSPYPETRRKMIERGSMSGTPCYRWLNAKSAIAVEYFAFIGRSDELKSSFHLQRFTAQNRVR